MALIKDKDAHLLLMTNVAKEIQKYAKEQQDYTLKEQEDIQVLKIETSFRDYGQQEIREINGIKTKKAQRKKQKLQLRKKGMPNPCNPFSLFMIEQGLINLIGPCFLFITLL